MNSLKYAICRYADLHAGDDGVAPTPVEGLRIKCVRRPTVPDHSIYKPLLCLVLQGAKQLTIGHETRLFRTGQSVIVGVDAPVTSRIVEASQHQPYVAVAIEIDMALLRELAAELGASAASDGGRPSALFVVDTDEAVMDCAMRLVRLIDTPEVIRSLRLAILKELHYWLLAGQHGANVRRLALPDGHAERIAAAARLLRAEFRETVTLDALAAEACMSVSTFARRFKAMTSLTPLQFQKQLRLFEARRLMLGEGQSASQAAFAVGYESVSHFTRDYGRLFGAPPRRDVRRTAERSLVADGAV